MSDSTIEAAAAVIAEWRGHVECPYDSDRSIARALAEAGLLRTEADTAVLDAAERLFDVAGGPQPTDWTTASWREDRLLDAVRERRRVRGEGTR